MKKLLSFILSALLAVPAFAILQMPAYQVSVQTNDCAITDTNVQEVLEDIFCGGIFLTYDSTGVVFNLEYDTGTFTWLMDGAVSTASVPYDLSVSNGYIYWTDGDGGHTQEVMTGYTMESGTVTYTIGGATSTNDFVQDQTVDTNGMAWTEGGVTNWFAWSSLPTSVLESATSLDTYFFIQDTTYTSHSPESSLSAQTNWTPAAGSVTSGVSFAASTGIVTLETAGWYHLGYIAEYSEYNEDFWEVETHLIDGVGGTETPCGGSHQASKYSSANQMNQAFGAVYSDGTLTVYPATWHYVPGSNHTLDQYNRKFFGYRVSE